MQRCLPGPSACSLVVVASQTLSTLKAGSAFHLTRAGLQDPRFSPVQALLAAAPADAPARRNFACSLVSRVAACGSQSRRLHLASCCSVVSQELTHQGKARIVTHCASQLDGIAAAGEDGDSGSVFGLAGLLLDQALEDGSLAAAARAPAAAAPVPINGVASAPAATEPQQPAKPVRQAAAVSKYDGLRQMLRLADVDQVGRLAFCSCLPGPAPLVQAARSAARLGGYHTAVCRCRQPPN